VGSAIGSLVQNPPLFRPLVSGRLGGFVRRTAAGDRQFGVAYDAAGNRASTSADGALRLWVTDHADPLKRPLLETDAAGVTNQKS